MYQGLSLDQAPPISVPLRFFLVAPIMALLAGGLLVFGDPAQLASRWSPLWLAATHLFALGFAAMVMMGAVFQMLPVVIGTPVAKPKIYGGLIHVLMTVGVLALSSGFYWSFHWGLMIGGICLFWGVLIFVALALECFFRSRSSDATAITMRWAVVSLAVTAFLGFYLVGGHLGWWGLMRPLFTRLHVAWGFVGWIFLLVAGVSYQVIPMFYVSSPYPKWLKKYWGHGILALLLLATLEAWSQLMTWKWPPLVDLMLWRLVIWAVSIYAVVTMVRIDRRKRKISDPTLWFWYTSLIMMVVASLIFVLQASWSRLMPMTFGATWEVGFGLFVLVGGAGSVIQAMLFKIVPFLVWFHLQSMTMDNPSLMGKKVPHMKQILPNRVVRRQWLLHIMNLFLLVFSLWVHESLFQLAGVGWCLQMIHLWYWLSKSYGIERRTRSQWAIEGLLQARG